MTSTASARAPVATARPAAPRTTRPAAGSTAPRRCLKAHGLKQPPAPTDKAEVKAAPTKSKTKPAPLINVIPNNGKWDNGIPPVMGAHLMASGTVAPISTSTGCGTGVAHEFQYRETEGDGAILQYGNKKQVASGLCKMVEAASAEAIAEKGSFTLVLSGGSLPSLLAGLAGKTSVDFSKWTVLWVDERNVPHTSPDSNYKAANEALLEKAGIPDSQIIKIAEGLPVEQAAIEYAGQMMRLPKSVLPRTEEGLPIHDMMLLGMGPDGHIASLFPNKSQTSCNDGSWVLPISNSPKPPPERITMTLPVINASKHVVMVATGESKAEIVHRTLETQALPGSIPAQLLAPTSGSLTWMLDANSCSMLEPLEWENRKAYPRSDLSK